MRTRATIMILAALLMLSPPMTPRAGALPAYQVEILYYNYGSDLPDGDTMQISCGGWSWTSGDTTPDHGGLKLVITTDCRTYAETQEWYRWDDCYAECSPPYPGAHYHLIGEPYYDNALCC